MKTYNSKPTDVEMNWHLIDAKGQTLGRLATQVAVILMGKNKPSYTPHIVCGDGVVVINASKIKVTGNKMTDKQYYRHSGYPGGIKSRSLEEMLEKSPDQVIVKAVSRMLPKNKLQDKMLQNLKVYGGSEHPHDAQKPVALKLEKVKNV